MILEFVKKKKVSIYFIWWASWCPFYWCWFFLTFHRASAAFVVDFVCAKSRAEVCPLLLNCYGMYFPSSSLLHLMSISQGSPFLVFLFYDVPGRIEIFLCDAAASLAKKKAQRGVPSKSNSTLLLYQKKKKRSRKKTVSQTSRARSCPPPNSWLMVWLGEGILGRIVVVALFGWRTGVLYHCHLRLQSLLCIFQQPPTLSFLLLLIPLFLKSIWNNLYTLSLLWGLPCFFSSLLPIIGDDWIRSNIFSLWICCGHLVVVGRLLPR